jgi:hypothetical protein
MALWTKRQSVMHKAAQFTDAVVLFRFEGENSNHFQWSTCVAANAE